MRLPHLSFRRFKSTDYIIWFVRKTSHSYQVLDKKRLNLDKQTEKFTVSYRDKTFIIPQESSIEDKNNHIIIFDYDNEKIVAFKNIQLGYDAKMLDQFLVKKIIAQIVAKIKQSLETESKAKIGTYILIAVCFSVIGYVVGSSYPIQTG